MAVAAVHLHVAIFLGSEKDTQNGEL